MRRRSPSKCRRGSSPGAARAGTGSSWVASWAAAATTPPSPSPGATRRRSSTMRKDLLMRAASPPPPVHSTRSPRQGSFSAVPRSCTKLPRVGKWIKASSQVRRPIYWMDCPCMGEGSPLMLSMRSRPAPTWTVMETSMRFRVPMALEILLLVMVGQVKGTKTLTLPSLAPPSMSLRKPSTVTGPRSQGPQRMSPRSLSTVIGPKSLAPQSMSLRSLSTVTGPRNLTPPSMSPRSLSTVTGPRSQGPQSMSPRSLSTVIGPKSLGPQSMSLRSLSTVTGPRSQGPQSMNLRNPSTVTGPRSQGPQRMSQRNQDMVNALRSHILRSMRTRKRMVVAVALRKAKLKMKNMEVATAASPRNHSTTKRSQGHMEAALRVMKVLMDQKVMAEFPSPVTARKRLPSPRSHGMIRVFPSGRCCYPAVDFRILSIYFWQDLFLR